MATRSTRNQPIPPSQVSQPSQPSQSSIRHTYSQSRQPHHPISQPSVIPSNQPIPTLQSSPSSPHSDRPIATTTLDSRQLNLPHLLAHGLNFLPKVAECIAGHDKSAQWSLQFVPKQTAVGDIIVGVNPDYHFNVDNLSALPNIWYQFPAYFLFFVVHQGGCYRLLFRSYPDSAAPIEAQYIPERFCLALSPTAIAGFNPELLRHVSATIWNGLLAPPAAPPVIHVSAGADPSYLHSKQDASRMHLVRKIFRMQDLSTPAAFSRTTQLPTPVTDPKLLNEVTVQSAAVAALQLSSDCFKTASISKDAIMNLALCDTQDSDFELSGKTSTLTLFSAVRYEDHVRILKDFYGILWGTTFLHWFDVLLECISAFRSRFFCSGLSLDQYPGADTLFIRILNEGLSGLVQWPDHSAPALLNAVGSDWFRYARFKSAAQLIYTASCLGKDSASNSVDSSTAGGIAGTVGKRLADTTSTSKSTKFKGLDVTCHHYLLHKVCTAPGCPYKHSLPDNVAWK